MINQHDLDVGSVSIRPHIIIWINSLRTHIDMTWAPCIKGFPVVQLVACRNVIRLYGANLELTIWHHLHSSTMWIPGTKGQLRGKCFHLIMLCELYFFSVSKTAHVFVHSVLCLTIICLYFTWRSLTPNGAIFQMWDESTSRYECTPCRLCHALFLCG